MAAEFYGHLRSLRTCSQDAARDFPQNDNLCVTTRFNYEAAVGRGSRMLRTLLFLEYGRTCNYDVARQHVQTNDDLFVTTRFNIDPAVGCANRILRALSFRFLSTIELVVMMSRGIMSQRTTSLL